MDILKIMEVSKKIQNEIGVLHNQLDNKAPDKEIKDTAEFILRYAARLTVIIGMG